MKFKSLQKKKRAGFTLVEMVIVVTILGILSGIGFMKFGNVQETSRKNADYAAAANLATAANLYLLENPNIDVNNKTISIDELKKEGYINSIPKSQSQNKEFVIKIVEVEEDGKKKEMYVKKGDKVVINSYAGTTIKYEGEELIIVKQADILAIVE